MLSLHRHALESIFGFLTLAELRCKLSSTRSFTLPITRMRPIDAAITLACSIQSAPSPLLRHVGRVGAHDQSEIQLSASQACSLALLSNLRVLRMELDCDTAVMPELPARLTELRLLFTGQSALDPDAVIRAAATLVHLTALSLVIRSVPVDCRPLQSLPALRVLELDCGLVWNLEQLDQLRAMPSLDSINIHASNDSLALLLRTPHQLRWKRVAADLTLEPDDSAMLTGIPSLTWLSCSLACKVDFMLSLPALRYLDLQLYDCLSESAAVVSALQSLKQLTNLSLSGSYLSDAELAAAFAVMPLLETLQLRYCGALLTLAPLTVGSLPRTLQSLTLCIVKFPSDDIVPHLSQLRSLTRLNLYLHMCAGAVDDAVLVPLRVPSVRLPKLLSCSIHMY